MALPHGARKQLILEATLDLIALNGVQRVSTQKIADHVGIAQSTVFKHFPNREAIFIGVVEWISQKLQSRIGPIFNMPMDPHERLKKIIECQLQFVSENHGFPKVLFSEQLHSESDALKMRVQENMTAFRARLAVLINEGVAQGRFTDVLPAEVMAEQIMALLQGTMMRWSVFDYRIDVPQEVEKLWMMVELVFLCPLDDG